MLMDTKCKHRHVKRIKVVVRHNCEGDLYDLLSEYIRVECSKCGQPIEYIYNGKTWYALSDWGERINSTTKSIPSYRNADDLPLWRRDFLNHSMYHYGSIVNHPYVRPEGEEGNKEETAHRKKKAQEKAESAILALAQGKYAGYDQEKAIEGRENDSE